MMNYSKEYSILQSLMQLLSMIKKNTSQVIKDVISGDPDPKNSFLSKEFTQYISEERFIVDTNEGINP